jgi:hypothetical protein
MINFSDASKVITLGVKYYHFGSFFNDIISVQIPKGSMIGGILAIIKELLSLSNETNT